MKELKQYEASLLRNGDYYLASSVDAKISRLNAKISELEKDARRYQGKCVNVREQHEYRRMPIIGKLKCESCGAIKDHEILTGSAIDSQLNVPGNK